MIFKVLIFFHLFNLIPNSSSCEVDFKGIGIRHFVLEQEKEKIELINDKSIQFQEIVNDEGYLVISFEEVYTFFKSKKVVRYKLIFRNNLLVSYNFMIQLEKGKESINSFNKIIDILKKSQINDFIKGDKYSYISKTKKCSRFIRMHSIGYEEYAFGGINIL